MMDAINTSKRQEDQKAQIENRIIKLKKEEERANKRIKDLQRRQKFMHDMNEQKTAHLTDIQNLRDYQHETENSNRSRFNEGRVYSQTRIMQSMERTFQSKRGAYNEIKNQQQRINEMVGSNNLNFLKDRQK